MSLTPLLEEGWFVTGHALFALMALGLGAWQIIGPKGGPRHRYVGYVWCALMMSVAASSFWIHTYQLIGPFSPIHILSILVLINVPLAIRHARAGNIKMHKAYMKSLFYLGLLVTGAITLVPGRAMHAVLFGQ